MRKAGLLTSLVVMAILHTTAGTSFAGNVVSRYILPHSDNPSPADLPHQPVEIIEAGFDLDGNSVNDPFVFAATASIDGGLHVFTVTVGASTCRVNGSYIYGTCSVVDLDTSDAYLEIAVPEMGPSGDFATHFLWFDGAEVRTAGTVPGSRPHIDGTGVVHSYARGNVLQTWFFPADYRLTPSRTLEFVERDLYPMGTPVTLKRELAVTADREDGPPLFTAEPGDRGLLVQTDDRDWCQIAMYDGRIGWFHCRCGIGSARGAEVFAGYPGEKWLGTVAVTLLQDVPLYSWETGMVTAFAIARAGEKGVLNTYRHESWLEFVTTTGIVGLLHRCENGYLGGFRSDEVFEGMCYAD